MTLAPLLIKYLIVGTAARILVSSVMFWLSSRGTLRSALTKTFFPLRSAALRSPTLFFAIDATPLGPLPNLADTAWILEATWRERRGSAAEPAKPRRRSGERREIEGRREEEREEEEEDDEGRREREEEDAAAAEAMAEFDEGLSLARERERERGLFKKEEIVVGN